MPPLRFQISYLVHAPYLRRADLDIDDRLAVVIDETAATWLIRDDHGEVHRIERAAREVHEPDPARGRWMVRDPAPAYAVGERVRLSWRRRNAKPAQPARPDRVATIVRESGSTVTVLDRDGAPIELCRVNGHQTSVGRQEPRWVIIDRVSDDDA